MKRRLAGLVLVGIALLTGCGSSSTTTVIQTTTASSTTTDAGLSDDDQRILEMLVSSGPQGMAPVCKVLARGFSEEVAYQEAMKKLSAVILQQGGQPSVVVRALLDRC